MKSTARFSPSPPAFPRWLAGASAALTLTSLLGSGGPLETPREFHLTADLDGDGRQDLVIVDRPSGTYRLAYQAAPDTFSWASARASGIENVAGVAAGRLLATTRDALAFTAPDANRVNLLSAENPALPAAPRSYYPPSLGPRQIAALDIGGAGNTAHDDLFLTTTLNAAPASDRQTLARSTGAAFTTLGDTASTAPVRRAARVHLKTGAAAFLGLTTPAGPLEQFAAFTLATGAPVLIASIANLPPDVRWVHHAFAASPLHQYLFYQPGHPELRLHAVTEPAPGNFSFSPPATFTLPQPVAALLVLPGAAGAHLLALFADGHEAAVYRFDGLNPPTLIHSFTAPAGDSFLGAVPLPNQGLMFLAGSPGGPSTRFDTRLFNGTTYTAGPTGPLPSLTPYAAPANVFVFQSEPFVHPAPRLVQRLAAGHWSSLPVLAGAPLQLTVTTEDFLSATAGLDNPNPRALGAVTPPGTFALVNQYANPISLFSFAPALGDEIVEVAISPPPGLQRQTVAVSFTTPVPGASIFYRLEGQTSWQTYTAPFPLFRNTTVRYYAQPAAGDQKSPIHHARYEFADPPESLDSDHDGVPDFVELGLDANNNGTPDYLELGQGLSPVTGNKDSDGDGFSDLNEIAWGRNPYSNASRPADHQRLEDHSGFDLFVSPRPLDGTTLTLTQSAPGTAVRLYDLEASLLREARTAPHLVPGVTDPAAAFRSLQVDTKQRLLALGTDPHFDLATPSPDPRLGRELVALLPVPDLPTGFAVPYTYAGGDLKTEAHAWAAAAQAAHAAADRATFALEPRSEHTLTALLLERQVELLLHSRGLDPTLAITLFGYRTADAGLHRPSLADLLDLERETDPAHPAYRLLDLHDTLADAVGAPTTPAASRLVDLAREIYRISSAFNQSDPGAYPLPVETLRAFLRTGTLPASYLAQTTLTPAQLTEAAAGIADLLALVQPRPKTTGLFTVIPGSSTRDCTLLADGPTPVSLVYPDGTRFLFPPSFQLIPGTTFQVTGYTDRPPTSCAPHTLEVIHIQLHSFPPVATLDTDGDLLPDGWECAFFGSLASGPHDDFDGDGLSNLQELLDGTDPADALAQSPVPVNLLPPALVLELSPGSASLKFAFPAAYLGHFQFSLLSSDTIEGDYSHQPVSPVPLGGDLYQIPLPAPTTAHRFYLITLGLK